MTNQTDAEYFASRAAAEWSLSKLALDPAVGKIHAQLAEKYERLAADLQETSQDRAPLGLNWIKERN